MQTISFAESGRAGSGVASAAWRKKSQLMKANLSSPRALCDGYVALGFCPRITRIDANGGQSKWPPMEEHPAGVVSKKCENDVKKGFGYSFDKAAHFCFHLHNPKKARLAVPSTALL